MESRSWSDRVNSKTLNKTNKAISRELPYYGINIPITHGQFNNSLSSSSTPKRYLDNLPSLYDLDFFNLNHCINQSIDPDQNIINNHIICRYFSPNSIHKKISDLGLKSDASFSVFHSNVRSLRKNIENLQTHVFNELEFPFSVIGITETRITNSNSGNFDYNIPGYCFEFVPTPLSVGGCGIFIREDYNYIVIEKTSEVAFQAIWVKIIVPQKKNIICGVLYRQHNNPERFLKYFEEKIELLTFKDNTVIVCADTNINLLRIDSCNYAHNFLLSLQSFSMVPCIDKPTRVYRNSATLIDNIFLNNITDLVLSGNIVTDLSDHFSQFLILNSTAMKSKIKNFLIRDYSHFSEISFNNELLQVGFSELLNYEKDDPNKLFSSFYNKLNKVINKHAPLKKLSKRKIKQFSKPWITKGIKTAIRRKNELFYSNDFDKYKLYRNTISTLTRISKKLYYKSYFSENISNMKKTWKGIRELMGRQKKSNKSVNALRTDRFSPLIHEPSKLANIMNSHFASCGHRLAAKLPHSEKHFSDFLDDQHSEIGSFSFHPVEPINIEWEIMALPSNKAYGLYSCPIRVLKCARQIISDPLAKIFNISIEQGIYPQKLKIAKIIPIFKCDDETDPNNYRPISLLSIFNKLFEKIMYKKLKSFLDINGIICDSQYGFREKHSTEHAILDIVNQIQTNMDKRLFSCGVFIDLSKAFDTVDHNILLAKLNHYGIRGVINQWFASYLKGRLQTTEIKNSISSKQETLCGVPQGSVLGPLLFLLYINDICKSSSILQFFLFADDTNLLYADKSLRSLEKVLNRELIHVSDWLIANRLTLNIKKSNYVIFRPPQKKIDYKPVIKLLDNNSQLMISLEYKDCVKYLGVLIDSHLSWKQHIDHIALKISKSVGLISKVRHFLPFHILANLYQSLILPYLSYSVVVWGRAANSHLNKLLILQKRVLRLMNFAQSQQHAVPFFLSSNFLPIHMIYFQRTANLMYDISNGVSPILIQNLFKKSNYVHNYSTRSASRGEFYVKSSRTEIQKHSFSRSGTTIWNSLPQNLRNESKKNFKYNLQSLLRNILETEDDYINVPEIITLLPKYKYSLRT